MAFNHVELFWALLVMPLLIILWPLLNFMSRRDRNRFANRELYETLARSISTTKRKTRTVSYMFGLVFLILALTGPRFGTRTEIVKRMGVDIVVVLDTSFSMLAEDIKPNRIMQAKYEVKRLIDHMDGDRIGLIAFAGNSMVICPLTTDYGAAKTFLEYTDVGMVEKPGTNFEEALAGTFNLLEKGSGADSESQLVILVTDGENMSGDPTRAAKKTAELGIRIFTVGIGSTSGEIIPIRDENGNIKYYQKDDKGNVVKTSLDEETLRDIARISKGSYFRAGNGELNIQSIIDELGSMHKADLHERKISRLRERYQIPLGIALFFLFIWFSLDERKRKW